MSPFARVADDAERVDRFFARNDLPAVERALAVMGGAIKGMTRNSGNDANFDHCCVEWMGRVLRLAEAKNAAREPGPEHWTEWFAEAVRRRTAREMALVKEVQK